MSNPEEYRDNLAGKLRDIRNEGKEESAEGEKESGGEPSQKPYFTR